MAHIENNSKISNNACCTYDFTMFETENIQVHDVRNVLKDLCKNYAFQIERADTTGALHYQGRMSLKIKKRLLELKTILDSKGWSKYHLSVTSTACRGNNFYVTKSDTRVSGPYTDENDIYVPRHIRKIKQLHTWQDKLQSILSTDNDRDIDVVYDPVGNNGKSTLTQMLMLHADAELLPFVNDCKDLMRMAYDVGPKKLYLIDMPRAISKEKLSQFFSGVEILKSGYCYDDRYKFQKRIFDRPRICIFTNSVPDMSLLSNDMWKLWTINSDMDLVPYSTKPRQANVDTVNLVKINEIFSQVAGNNNSSIADLESEDEHDILKQMGSDIKFNRQPVSKTVRVRKNIKL